MDKLSLEVKFLIGVREKFTKLLPASKLGSEFDKEVNRLVQEEIISPKAREIMELMYKPEQPKPAPPVVVTRQADPDPCSMGYSGMTRGGCS